MERAKGEKRAKAVTSEDLHCPDELAVGEQLILGLPQKLDQHACPLWHYLLPLNAPPLFISLFVLVKATEKSPNSLHPRSEFCENKKALPPPKGCQHDAPKPEMLKVATVVRMVGRSWMKVCQHLSNTSAMATVTCRGVRSALSCAKTSSCVAG